MSRNTSKSTTKLLNLTRLETLMARIFHSKSSSEDVSVRKKSNCGICNVNLITQKAVHERKKIFNC